MITYLKSLGEFKPDCPGKADYQLWFFCCRELPVKLATPGSGRLCVPK